MIYAAVFMAILGALVTALRRREWFNEEYERALQKIRGKRP